MSNPQQQQQQQHQQQQQNQPKGQPWKPTQDTIFFLLSDQEFATRARAQIRRLYPELKQPRCVTEINTQRLSDRHTIVPVYQDPDLDIVDAQTKEPRARKPAVRASGPGLAPTKAEPPDVLFGAPVEVKRFWYEGDGESDSAVQLNNLINENGSTREGLISTIAKQVRPCVVHPRPDIHELTMRTV